MAPRSSKRSKVTEKRPVEVDKGPNNPHEDCRNEESLIAYRTKFTLRSVPFPRPVDFKFFDVSHIELQPLFARLGWHKFVACNLPMYPRLVKLFYANLYHPNPKLRLTYKCELFGHNFVVSPESIRRTFRLPKGDFECFDTHGWCEFEDFDPVSALQQICERPDISVAYKPKISELSLMSRLIHNIIVHTLLPRKGSFSSLSYIDIFLIWCILNGKKIDLGHVICSHMSNCRKAKDKDSCLPYGMHLTMLFQLECFPVSKEIDVRVSKSSDIFGKANLIRMGYYYDEKLHQWLSKDAEDAHGANENARAEEANHCDEEANEDVGEPEVQEHAVEPEQRGESGGATSAQHDVGEPEVQEHAVEPEERGTSGGATGAQHDVLMQAFNGQLQRLQASVERSIGQLRTSIESKFTALEKNIETVPDSYSLLESRVTKIECLLGTHGERISDSLHELQTDVNILKRRADEAIEKSESSRRMYQNFVDHFQPLIEKYEKSLHERQARKEWKRKYNPDHVNLG
jgi:hypothetical protein